MSEQTQDLLAKAHAEWHDMPGNLIWEDTDCGYERRCEFVSIGRAVLAALEQAPDDERPDVVAVIMTHIAERAVARAENTDLRAAIARVEALCDNHGLDSHDCEGYTDADCCVQTATVRAALDGTEDKP